MKIIAIGSITWVNEDSILLTHSVITHSGYNALGEYAYIYASRTRFDRKWYVHTEIFGRPNRNEEMTTKELYKMIKEYNFI